MTIEKRKYIIGIDPGLSGAIAVFNDQFGLIGVRDMPVMAALVGRGRVVDCIELAKLFKAFAGHDVICIIETVSSMPGQGVASMFKFGKAAMAPEAMAHLMGFKVSMVTPQKWKRAAGLIKKPKEASLSKAKELYPEMSELFRLKKHEGRAEAVLIGYFGAAFVGPGVFATGEAGERVKPDEQIPAEQGKEVKPELVDEKGEGEGTYYPAGTTITGV